MDYLVSYKAVLFHRPTHIKTKKQFPEEVSINCLYRFENKDQLRQQVIQDYAQILRNNGLTIIMDEKPNDPTKLNIEDRYFIPMHMISYMYTEVKQISGEVQLLDEEGNLSIPSGGTILKN